MIGRAVARLRRSRARGPEARRGGVDICFVIGTGIAERMILQSGVLRELDRLGLSTVVVVPTGMGDALHDTPYAADVEIVEHPFARDRLQRFLLTWRTYLLDDVAAHPALLDIHERRFPRSAGRRARLTGELRMAVSRAITWARLSSALRRLLTWALAHDRQAIALLQAVGPRMVVTTSPFDEREAAIMAAGTRLGITTVDQILSWDNVTTKGQMLCVPDAYVVWGPVMRDEVVELYRGDPERIHECGAPHFAAHARADDGSLPALFERLGIEPTTPYVLLALSLPFHAPAELEIATWLAGAIERGDLGPDTRLVIRPHPQSLEGFTEAPTAWQDELASLDDLPGVSVWRPGLVSANPLQWQMQQSDMALLAGVVAHCTVCVNSGSTLALEALIHGRPTVITSFDADRSLPYRRSAARCIDFVHLDKLLAFDAIAVTRGFDELEAELVDAFEHPERRAEAGRRTVEQYVGADLVSSAARVAAAVASELARPGPG